MNKIYLITGPAGVGKSTVSKEIAFKLDKSVLIEGDDIYHQVIGNYHSPWHELNHLDTFWKVIINMIKTYLNEGYNVVFNYIIEPKTYQKLKETFNDNDIIFTVLMIEQENLIKRDLNRPEDCRMNNRCIELLEEFKKYNYNKNDILYTDNLTIKETVDKILKGEQNER